MIEFKLFFALISYYFVMFATPGPNNAMLTASGIKFGFKKTLPLKFYEAALFQFINPKAWVVALTAATAFFPSEENFFIATSFVALTAPFVCLPSICLWVLFGSSIKLIIKNTKIKKIIEYLLALLLIITAVIIVFD